MSLAPQVSRVLDLGARAGDPEYHQMRPPAARAAHEQRAGALDLPSDPVAQVRDLLIAGGAGPRTARVDAPRASGEALPILLWLPGGGHTPGSIH